MRRLAAATALAALLAAGCKTGSAVTSSPDPSTNEGTWAAARDRFTRTHKLYDVLDDVAFATATWQSPAVRAARVERLAEWKGLAPAEREAMLASERAAAENRRLRLARNFEGKLTPGLININTAPVEVMRAMPHMTRLVYDDDFPIARTSQSSPLTLNTPTSALGLRRTERARVLLLALAPAVVVVALLAILLRAPEHVALPALALPPTVLLPVTALLPLTVLLPFTVL